ncbi:potassium channel family protein [Amphibacillus cookii]|uniref:potassium channel family protein n=1 Tax=Amphibacillus cookii TaxID=767787 RepID=UPI00195E95C4|nr:potassium channel family protein [Amphibacillus cookii]MBM7541414.1 voltage-gated potassium channel [Amphibacillus cookii]
MIVRIRYYYLQLPTLLKLLIIIGAFMIGFGSLIHFVEPNIFPTVFDGIWWALITGSTVGYGDYVPHTLIGRLLTLMLILGGGGAITFYMATISATTIKAEQQRNSGLTRFQGKAHLIVIGWNERTRQLVHLLQNQKTQSTIVLIDQTLAHLPANYRYLHFVKGDPTIAKTLSEANAEQATAAIVTADPGKEERYADQASILTVIALRSINDDISIHTEILTTEQVDNAKHAGATAIIETNRVLAEMFEKQL